MTVLAWFDGGHDVGIGRAAAQIAAHIFADFGVGAGMALMYAGDRREYLPGRAITALECIIVDEGLLMEVQLAVFR
jgi:hypothetical protein